MQHDLAYILDILDAAKLAIQYVQDIEKEAFFQDIKCQDSVIRRLEIIGEAARRVSLSTRAEIPDIPWMEMIGMRNMMIHEYDSVDLEIVWDTIQRDLPRVIVILSAIAPKEAR